MDIKKKRILLTIILGILLVLMFYIISNAITKFTGYSISEENIDDFTKCIEENQITLYINTLNTVKTLKQNNFIDYLDKIKIVNCARNKKICSENSIKVFPTWIINNKIIEKQITLEELFDYTNCKNNKVFKKE